MSTEHSTENQTPTVADVRKTVALTGGTGFVGRATLARLLDAGWAVRVLVRKPDALEPHPHIQTITGHLHDETALSRLCAGAEVVVHIAGATRATCAADFNRINGAAVGRVYDAAAASGVAHFVHVSSFAARHPGLSAYAASKAAGEEALKAAHRHAQAVRGPRAPTFVILRPPSVYGPGDSALLPLFRSAAKGIALCLGQARNALIHIDDLADALVLAVQTPSLAGLTLDVHDGAPLGYSHFDVARLAAKGFGRHQVSPVAVPTLVAKLLGLCADLHAKATGRPHVFSSGKVRELLHADWTSDDHRLTRLAGWDPRWTGGAGIGETARWYRSHKWA